MNRLILKGILVVAFAIALCFGLIGLRHQRSEAKNNVRALEQKIMVEQRKLSELGAAFASRTSTPALLRGNQLFSLDLGIPDDRQIVRVTVDVEARLGAKNTGGLLTAANSYRD